MLEDQVLPAFVDVFTTTLPYRSAVQATTTSDPYADTLGIPVRPSLPAASAVVPSFFVAQVRPRSRLIATLTAPVEASVKATYTRLPDAAIAG